MKNLMIVDDSIFVFEDMKRILKNTDINICGYAKSGEEALEKYEEFHPDFLTLDIIMPGMDGLETAKKILEKWPDAKIIIISSLAYDETMKQAQGLGVKDFLFKPIESEQLIEVLEKVAAS